MTTSSLEAAATMVRYLTRWQDDFPEPGIRFADLTPVFADANGFRAVIDALAEVGEDVQLVAGIDARGFLLAAGVARALDCGVLAVRKAGKLPPPVRSRGYTLEYGVACLEIPAEGVDLTARRVLLIDDVLATGGTINAAAALLESAGAEVVSLAVVLELAALYGRDRLDGRPLTALVQI